jgi:hypothetical protein
MPVRMLVEAQKLLCDAINRKLEDITKRIVSVKRLQALALQEGS